MQFRLFLAALASIPLAASQTCSSSHSQPNPIASRYPNDATGTVNGTLAIIPIDYTLARSIVPAQYPILKAAYQSLLPSLPKDKYPMFVNTFLDHDIRSGALTLGDFSRAAFQFPFVDRLNDGYSSFRFAGPVVLTPSPLVLAGAKAYGPAYPGKFTPECEAYDFVPGSKNAEIFFKGEIVPDPAQGKVAPKKQVIDTKFSVLGNINKQPYSIEFFKNITNQPNFGTTDICDNFILLFNTTLTTGKYEPQAIKGSVHATAPFLPKEMTFKDVFGLKLDGAFIERNYKQCDSLKGYTKTGSGD